MRHKLFLLVTRLLLSFSPVFSQARQEQPKGHQIQLDCGLHTKEQGVGFRNYDHFAYQKVRILVNNEYVYHTVNVAPGAIISIPWSAFGRADGSHYTKRPAFLNSVLIYAENAAGDYGTVLIQHKPRA